MKHRFRWGRWNIHFCALDETCRSVGAPLGRVSINTPVVHVSMAFIAADKFLGPWGVGESWFKIRWVWQRWAIERRGLLRDSRRRVA